MILSYEEIDREEWSRLVRTSATGTWFQTPEAYCFYESMPEFFRPFVVAVERTDTSWGMCGVCDEGKECDKAVLYAESNHYRRAGVGG